MKNIILVPSLAIIISLAASAYVPHPTTDHSGKTMAYAMDSTGKVLDSAEVDPAGNYGFAHLNPGTYSVLFKTPGYLDLTIQKVEHAGAHVSYHATLDLQRKDIDIPTDLTVKTDNAMRDGEGDLKAEVKEISGSRIATAKAPAFRSVDEYIGRGTRSKAVSPTATMEPEVAFDKTTSLGWRGRGSGTGTEGSMSRTEDLKTGTGDMPTTAIKAGQVTAGFWRDLDNWEKWNETNKDPNVALHKNTWGFYTDNRFSVRFLDAGGKPVIGKKAELWDSRENLCWQAVTDNQGNAEFFANLNSAFTTKDFRTYRVKISSGERVFEFKIDPYKGSSDIVNLPVKHTVNAVAEVAFVVDATGSMGDEIRYLQSELLDVIARVKKSNQCVDLRMASVFYRDQTDAYLTVSSDFSSNPLDIVNFIYNQSAGGGGDFPEAVDAALETTVDKLSWSENSITKLMFLVLDAPPHDDSVSAEKVRKYTKMAAAKGIKIIPVTASGINQSTEFLMKYMAIATNGNYIYITDHSGIGNPHEKPTGVKENVQYLNDLMVDIINQNTAWAGCTDSTANKPTPGTVEIVTNGQWQVQFYPNPAIDHIMVKSSEVPDEIGMYDLTGNLVKQVQQISGEKTVIDLKGLVTGVYIVKCRKGEAVVTCRMLVMP